jgi:aromatic-L-amino-acid decarboxylase
VPDIAPGDVRAMLPEHPPSVPETWSDVKADIDRVVLPTIAHWQHPNWFAYFPANTTHSSILGELLSAGLGVQGMSWVTSPACTEIETLMLDWMLELLDLPDRFRSTTEHGGGVIQGSASEAVLVAILAARWKATAGAINEVGDTSRLVAYATSQAHSSVEKGLRIAGIGAERIRIVDHDEQFAMRADALGHAVEADIQSGFIPFFVCSTHGTTSSLAIDPTPEIADVCERAGAWLHVDGAMAGIAALVPELRSINAGLDRADSYCTNPHKWMGVNFDCTLFWTADRASLLGALSILPEYLRSAAAESGAAIDYRDWQVPLGRRFRALKLWFNLRLDGVEAARGRIRRDVGLAEELAGWVEADPAFELAAPRRLNLVCLRVAGDDDAATDELIERINSAGEFHVTRTVLDGRSVLRVSIGARTTERANAEALWSALTA